MGEWVGDEVSGVEKLKKLRSESPGGHGWEKRPSKVLTATVTEGPGLRRDRIRS